MPDLENVVRLKKSSDDKIVGPMSIADLKQLADTALVSPEDFYDQGDGNWKPVWELEAIEMFWIICAEDGGKYGPTTIGTIKEFLVAGEVTPQDKVTHTRTSQEMTIVELLGPDVVLPNPKPDSHIDDKPSSSPSETKRIGTLQPQPQQAATEEVVVHDPFAAHGQDIARDLRIRQLELDYSALQEEHERLLHEYRKLNEQFVTLKNSR